MAAELVLLGGFRLTVAKRAVRLSATEERLLAFLALQDGARLRIHVAGSLWLESAERRASANLRSLLWRLRRFGQPLVETDGGRLALHAAVQLDLRRVLGQAARLVARRDCEPADLDPDPLTHDLLPDWYDEWVLIERERFRHLRLHALEALAARLAAERRFAEAIEAAYAVVRVEPFRESAHRVLIAVHLAEGNRIEAVNHYRRLYRSLRQEIGVEPSFRMEDLDASWKIAPTPS